MKLLRLAPGGAILCFHGISSERTPSASLANVPLDRFIRMIRTIRRIGRIVPLRDLLERRAAGARNAGLVAVTFDDAYRSLATEAAGFLAESGIHTTVFVSTRASATGDPFWWDRIEDLLPRTGKARWRRFEDECGLPAEYRAGQPAEYGAMRPIRQWILASTAGRGSDAISAAITRLETEVGFRTHQRPMTFPELAAFAEATHTDFGVHTETHPVLPLIGDDEAQREIRDCHVALRARFGNVVPILAIPFGLFDRRTAAIAAAAGMHDSLTLAGRTLERAPAAAARFCITEADRPLRVALRVSGVPQRIRSLLRSSPEGFPELPSPRT